MKPSFIERLNALRKKDPFINSLFVGWMCGTDQGQLLGNGPPVTMAGEIERFLSHYESRSAGSPATTTPHTP